MWRNEEAPQDTTASENPDRISGLSRRAQAARDPDVLMPTNKLQLAGHYVHHFGSSLSSPSVLFAAKGGILAGLLFMPAAFPAYAYSFNEIRGVWAGILASLTLARFVGESV